MTADTSVPRRRRLWYLVAALGASAVAILFATVGDGVDVPDATGLRRVVLDTGHQLVWVLLGGAFAVAAARGRWSGVSQALALGGGVVYVVFLVAVFLWS